MMAPIAYIAIPTSRWLGPAGVLLLAALILLLWSYRRARPLRGFHRVCFALKTLGVLILALWLLEPMWIGRRAKAGANSLAILADNSSTMTIRDVGQTKRRGDFLREALDTETAGWLAKLAENFEIRRYFFDSRLHRTLDFSELAFDGQASAIGTNLRVLADRFQDKPLAGILLMTDGNPTDLSTPAYDLSGLPPVYPVVVGHRDPPKDIAVTNVSVTQTAFEDAPVTIQADVAVTGFAGQTISVDLKDSTGAVVQTKKWLLKKRHDKQRFRFRLRPQRAGVLFYTIAANAARLPAESAEQENRSQEATLLNNQRTVVVKRDEGPYRILYVTGRPNWEYKFLRRAIEEDEQIHLVGLIRAAKREPKYDWRGRAGEQSNPLFRGYDTQNQEQTEEYDQPVLVRLNTRDAEELRDGFPRTAEELYAYHAVILDDIEAEFFLRDQMDLIRRFVSERGGGFLMLGGKESFQQGQYAHTPISSILPVYLDRLPESPRIKRTRMALTRGGWLQPWARLRDNEQAERERLRAMPDFRVLNRLRGVKPGAQVIATVDDERDARYPALIVQRFGNGRSAALPIGDVWRWGLQSPEMREDMEKFWRQTLRWLVANVPQRISVEVVQGVDLAQQAVRLRVYARDKDFQPLDNVFAEIEIQRPAGDSIRLNAQPVAHQGGVFETTLVSRASGGYSVHAVITDAEGNRIGAAETGWAVDLLAQEFASLQVNRALLEDIARQTGGRVVELDELDRFARMLPHLQVPITTTWSKPLFDLPGLGPAAFLLVLICFGSEWALRRWKGMP